MFKFITLFISILIINLFTVNISSFNAISCDNFEVSYIEDDGNFTMISCHNSLDEAKNIMKTNKDYVIRHRSSDSPMDIVAMNSGIAYIYTHRYSDKATIGLWERPYDKNYVQSYSDSYRDVFYIDTTEFDTTNGEGTITGILNGFNGGIGLEYTDLVPDKFFRLNLPITIGGGYRERSYHFIPRRSYYDVVLNGNYRDLVYHYFPGYGNDGGYSNHYSYAIGPAPDFMKENKKYYSYNGYDFYDDMEAKNKVGTAYNYYQFLPLRSKSQIKAESYNKFLKYFEISEDSKLYNAGQYFLDSQQKYGVNAALIFGVAVNESAFGRSYFARERNNLFGLNAVDADPSLASRYSSILECIETMFSYYVQSYIDLDDWRFFGSSLGNKGSGLNLKYASDPHWSIKAAKYAYMLDKIDNDFNGQLTDYKKYDFKKINQFDIPFKKQADDNSETLDTSKYGKTYQENFMVIPLEKVGDYTKIQFTNPIINDKVLKWKDIQNKTPYNWEQSVAYVKTQYLDDVYKSNSNQQNITLNFEKVELENNILKIKFRIINFENDLINSISKLIIKNNNQIVQEVELNYTLDNNTMLFEKNIELNLRKGEYDFEIINNYNSKNTTHPLKYLANNFNYQYNGFDYNILTLNPLKIRINNIENNVKHYAKQVLTNLSFDENQKLSIEGLALIDRFNIINQDDIKHQLVIKNVETGNVAIEELESYDYSIDLRDGYTYNFVGYRGKIDFDDYKFGKYQLLIRITVNGLVKDVSISSNSPKFDNIFKENDDYKLRVSSNQKDAFKIIIEKFKHNYYDNNLNKPSRRSSFLRFDQFDLIANKIKLEGTGIIFETNMNDVYYKLLLINDNIIKEYPLLAKSQNFDLTGLLKSKYQLNLSKFKDEFNLENLTAGNYQVKFHLMANGFSDVVDVELYGNSNIKYFENDRFTYEVKISEIDKTINLIVREKINE